MAVLSSLPEGANVLDLDAERVARQEVRVAQGVGASFVKVSAGFIEVKPEIPLAAAYALKDEQIREGLGMLLADPADVDALWPVLSAEDFQSLINFITGKTPGESQA
jgi:hypothetical protein